MKKPSLLALFLVLSFACAFAGACGRSRSSQNLPDERVPPGSSSISVSVSPGTSSIDIGGVQQFTANVTGTANRAVTWRVSGPACERNDACGTIDTMGLYRAPDEPPNPPGITITATSLVDTGKSGDATVSITTQSNVQFSGQYAFLINGFEGSSAPVAIAGSFSADGRGGVLPGGVVDLNRRDGMPITVRVTGGSYSYGADNRGRLTLNTEQEPFTFRFAMSSPNPPQHNGRIILFHPDSHLTGSGMVRKQAGPFSTSSLNGEFAVELRGATTAGRTGAVGIVSIDGGGRVSNGKMEFNFAGTALSNLDTSGSYSIGPDTGAANGRGVATLNSSSMGMLNFAVYILSAQEAFFIGLDPRTLTVPMLSGSALKRSASSYAADSINGALVFNVTGISDGSDVTIGRFDAANQRLSGTLDENAAGVVTSSAPFTGAYGVGANGRGTLNFALSPTQDISYVFYLVAPNKAFLLQSTAPQVGVGALEAQSGAPFGAVGLSGNWVIGTANPSQCGCSSVSGVVSINGGSASFVGSRDRSRPDGLFPRGNWAGQLEVASNGRGSATATVSLPPTIEHQVLYVVSPSKVMLIDVDRDAILSSVTVLEK